MPSGLRRSADNQTRRSSSHFILPHPLSSPLQMSLLAVLGVCCCLRAKKNCTRREGDALLHPYFTTGPGVQPEAEFIGRRSGRHLRTSTIRLVAFRCFNLGQGFNPMTEHCSSNPQRLSLPPQVPNLSWGGKTCRAIMRARH